MKVKTNNRDWWGRSPEEVKNVREWLKRAHINAKTAQLIVRQNEPDLLVEAVNQVQQACEKGTKALMLANGITYAEVKAMRHNTIGAFVELIAKILVNSPIAQGVSQVLVTPGGTDAANESTKLVLSGSRNKGIRKNVNYAWKQVLPESRGELGNRALEVDEWRSLTRAFPPQLVESFIEFHEYFCGIWRQYINGIHNVYADPRPLLAGEVNPETWVFSPAYAGLPRRFPGQEWDAPSNPVLENLAQQLLKDSVEQIFGHVDEKHWPDRIDMRRLLLYVSNWLTSLGWLFLCATVTTPHATSSRYPAEEIPSNTEKGSQHYSYQLGVVACIGPLANHTEDAVGKLINHYRQIENGYRQMLL